MISGFGCANRGQSSIATVSNDAISRAAWSYRRWERTQRAKLIKRAKQIFNAASQMRLILENPFGHMKKLTVGEAEKFYVTRDMAANVLAACIDNQWKLIFALCRFGGLRCPSEILLLRWERRLGLGSGSVDRPLAKDRTP